ncbi:MAG: ABC transporter substrate-binding protein [Betaproteobacteria bacterium]|jgi:NitT/TauT family transport system substrate-binding protein|nr:ABC transporter substrate-binding protein [Betaproteobacteria bacterium]
MQEISIQFTRFSAFYSPLIATIAGGFLDKEGLKPKHSVSPPGVSAIAGLVDGSVHVAQSAPSQAITVLEQGKTPPALHFAQVNEKDGFFLVGRKPEPDFSWDRLKGRGVLVDHGGQPTVMFQYACHKRGLDYGAIRAIDAGSPDKMIAAFKGGEGEYIHLQGPAPQQLEHDGHGHIVAALGDAIGPCAFSSLAATREWLASEMAKAFMRAYRKARAWLIATPAAEVARREAAFFPDIDPKVLEATIAAYQKLGNWSPHVEITRPAYEATLDIFQHAGKIKTRPRYEDAIAPPPA